MTDRRETKSQATDREELQQRLASIDRDPEALQELIRELYNGHSDNPQIFYLAAVHLTSLVHLRDESGPIALPEQHEAMRAFEAYTALLSMLHQERHSPIYQRDRYIADRVLLGPREEIAFHSVFAYARSQGADIIALPTPSKIDFDGDDIASDIYVYTDSSTDRPTYELQIKRNLDGPKTSDYHPRIPVLSLTSALGSRQRANELQHLLRSIGSRDGTEEALSQLLPEEHDLILMAASDILANARAWTDNYEMSQPTL